MPDQNAMPQAPSGRTMALGMSTLAFTVCFAVWTIFSIIGIQIKKDLGLTDTQFGLLVGTPILTGSLIRLILGIWTDQYGGRVVYAVDDALAAVDDLAADLSPTTIRPSCWRRSASALPAARSRSASPTSRAGTPRRSRAPRSASSAPAMSARPSPSSSRPSSWSPTAGRRSRDVWAARWLVTAVVFFCSPPRTIPSSPRDAGPARSPSRMSAMLEPLQEHPGLALLALLLLRLRRLRRAVAVAAALPDRRLRPRHHDRRHDRRGLFGPGHPVPRLWRHLSDKFGARRIMYWTFVRLGRLHASCCPIRRPSTS